MDKLRNADFKCKIANIMIMAMMIGMLSLDGTDQPSLTMRMGIRMKYPYAVRISTHSKTLENSLEVDIYSNLLAYHDLS